MKQGLQTKGLKTVHVGPIDLSIAPGECVAIRGPSGAGKSLLLRAIADLDPHEGALSLDGTEHRAVPPQVWRSRVGMLPAESHWWRERIGDCLPEVDGLDAMLARLGFTLDVMDWRVERVSTGERQRLALIRLLLNRPRTLLLDEPTANLDPESTAAAERLIEAFRTENNAPVLWVGHDVEQLRRVAHRHLYIDAGQITQRPL